MATKLGLNAKLYRNTGTYGSPTWAEWNFLKDLSLEMSTGEADATTRANGGWKATVATLKDASLTFSAPHDVSIATYKTLVDGFYANTAFELLVLDQAIATVGATGLRASFMVTSMTEGQPIEDIQANDFTLKITASDNDPVQYTVAS